MSVTGIDIAWDRPTIAQIKATGAKWVARYFSTDDTKNLHASEVRDYTAAGLGVVTVFETTTGRATQGYQAGIDDATLAEGQRKSVGLPDTMVIHLAVDEDTSWASVEAYFRGASVVLGQQRVGVYGGLRVIEGAYTAGYRFLWQTPAWSGGQWSAHATIRQSLGTTLSGGADYDTAEAPDFGQYPRPTTPQPAPTPVPTLTIGENDMPAGQLVPGFGVDAKGTVAHPELASVVWLGGKNTGAVSGSWLALFCDFGTARVRVAIHGPKGWDIRLVDLDAAKGAVWVQNIADGATHASILRVDRSTATAPDKSAATPVGYGTVMEVK